MSRFNDDLDRIDASVFSGDALHEPSNRDALREMCNRWIRTLDEYEVDRCDLCNYKHGHQIGCANNPVDIALIEPICPHCNQPVKQAHSAQAVLIEAAANGFRTRTGPYHGECGKIVAHRAIAAPIVTRQCDYPECTAQCGVAAGYCHKPATPGQSG